MIKRSAKLVVVEVDKISVDDCSVAVEGWIVMLSTCIEIVDPIWNRR